MPAAPSATPSAGTDLVHPQRCAIHARNRASPISPPATRRITRSVSSGSPGAAIQVRPLRSTNSIVARYAQRLLPSGSGWFLTRCQQRTAAFAVKSGYRSTPPKPARGAARAESARPIRSNRAAPARRRKSRRPRRESERRGRAGAKNVQSDVIGGLKAADWFSRLRSAAQASVTISGKRSTRDGRPYLDQKTCGSPLVAWSGPTSSADRLRSLHYGLHPIQSKPGASSIGITVGNARSTKGVLP